MFIKTEHTAPKSMLSEKSSVYIETAFEIVAVGATLGVQNWWPSTAQNIL